MDHIKKSNRKKNCDTEIKPNSALEPDISMQTQLSKSTFELIMKHIKEETLHPVPNEYSDYEDVKENSRTIFKKTFQQGNMSTQTSGSDLKTIAQVHENTKLLTTCKSKNYLRKNSHLTNHQISKSNVTSLNLPKAHNCTNSCEWCTISFGVYDKRNHIGCIQNINEQNSYLKLTPYVKIDSCLCDRCWKFLERTYKCNIRATRRKISSDSNNVNRDFEEEPSATIKHVSQCLEKHNTKNYQTFFCSVHKCKQKLGLRSLSLNEYIKIKEMLLLTNIYSIILIESFKWGSNQHGPISLSVCEKHFHTITVLTTCQLCGYELGKNLDVDDWKMYDQWNCTLKRNNIPFKLLPGMFLCNKCRSFVSNDLLFSSIDLESILQNVKKRNDICMTLFEYPENNAKKTNKFGDLLKNVSFAKPLKISSYEDDFKMKKKLDCSEMPIDSKVQPNVNIDSYDTEIATSDLIDTKDERLSSINGNDKDINVSLKLEVIDVYYPNGNKVQDDTLSTNTTKKNLTWLKKYSDDIFSGSHNPRPNKRIRKLMSLVEKDENVKIVGSSSILSQQIKENLPKSLIKLSTDVVLNINDSHFDEICSTNENTEIAQINNENNLVPSHTSNLLDIYKNLPKFSLAFSLTKDNFKCRTNKKKTDPYVRLNTCAPSIQINICVKETKECPESLLQQNDTEMTENMNTNIDISVVSSITSHSNDETVCRTNPLNTYALTTQSNINECIISDEKTEECSESFLQQNDTEMIENVNINNNTSVVSSMSSHSNDEIVCRTNDHYNTLTSFASSAQSNIDVCIISDEETKECQESFLDQNDTEMIKNVLMISKNDNIKTVGSSSTQQMSVVSSISSHSNDDTVHRTNNEKTDPFKLLISDSLSVQSNINVCNISDEETEECPESFLHQNDTEMIENININNDISVVSSMSSHSNDKTVHRTNNEKTGPFKLLISDSFSIQSNIDVCNISDEETEECPESFLQQNDTKMIENININNDISVVSSMSSHSNDETVCRTNNEKTGLFKLLISDSFSVQSDIDVCNISDEEIEEFPEFFSKQNNVDQGQSSSDSDNYEYLTKEYSVLKKKKSKKFDHSTNLLFPKRSSNLKVLNRTVNPTETRKRLRDIIHQRSRGIKKQRLNDLLLNKANSSFLDNNNESSTIDSSTHKNIFNLDYNNVDMPNMPCDEDETMMSNDSADVQNVSSDDELIRSNDSNCMNYFSPIEFNIDEPSSEDESASDYEILLDDKTSSGINQFPKPDFQPGQENNKNDNFDEFRFDLDECNESIYKDLLARFNDPSAVISYLLENERLLYSGQLVLSDNADPYTTNYIKKHLDVLSAWYGEPENHDLSESFISPLYPEARLYSQRLSSDISDLSEEEETNVDICSPLESQKQGLENNVLSSSPSSNDSSGDCVSQIQKDIPSLTFLSSCSNHSVNFPFSSPSNINRSVNCVPQVQKNMLSCTLASSSIDNSTNFVSQIQKSVSSSNLSTYMPIMSRSTSKLSPLAPRQYLPTSIPLPPRLNVCQRQPVPHFQLPTAVRSKAFLPIRPLCPKIKNKKI